MKRSALLLMLAALLVTSQGIAQITVTKGSAASLAFKSRAVATSALYWNFTLEQTSFTNWGSISAANQTIYTDQTWTGLGVVTPAAGVSTFTGVLYFRGCNAAPTITSSPSNSTCGTNPVITYSNCTSVFTDTDLTGTGIGSCVHYFGKAPKYGYIEVRNLPVKNVNAGP